MHMAFKLFKKQNPEDMPPQQRAQRAQLSIGIRIVVCGYLGYLGITLLKQAIAGETGINQTLSWVIPFFFLAAALFLMVNLILELVRNYKAGVYSAATYATEEEDGDEAAEDGSPDPEERDPEDETASPEETAASDGDEEE